MCWSVLNVSGMFNKVLVKIAIVLCSTLPYNKPCITSCVDIPEGCLTDNLEAFGMSKTMDNL